MARRYQPQKVAQPRLEGMNCPKMKNARNTDLSIATISWSFPRIYSGVFASSVSVASLVVGTFYEDSLALWQNKKTLANQRKQSHLPVFPSSSTYQKSSIKNGHKVNHSKIWEIHVFSLRTRTPSRFSIRKVGSNFWGFHAEGQHGPSFGSTLGPYVHNAVDWLRNRRQDWWQIKHSWLSVDA